MSDEYDGKVAVAVPYNPDIGCYLILKRSKDETSPGMWNFPGGGVEEEDSSIRESALRELEEETGLCGEVVRSTDGFFWDGNVGDFKVYGFLVHVDSRSVELDEEHSEYEWIEIEELEEFEMVGRLEIVERLGMRR